MLALDPMNIPLRHCETHKVKETVALDDIARDLGMRIADFYSNFLTKNWHENQKLWQLISGRISVKF